MKSSPGPRGPVTTKLEHMAAQRPHAASELLPLVYAELRKLATRQMARLRPGETLQPTALVHEAYVKLVGSADPRWNGRGHFFCAAGEAMRQVIVDHVRRKVSIRRGGGRRPETLELALGLQDDTDGPEQVLAVDEALRLLAADHPRKAQLVVMRYFAGLAEHEIAEALGVTTRTVERDWRFARAYLHQVLGET